MHLSIQQPRTHQKLFYNNQQKSISKQRSKSFSRHKTNPSNKPVIYQNQTTDPQVSQFQIDTLHTDHSLYIHNLHIDYGKLERPYYLQKLKMDQAFGDLQNNIKTNKINKILNKVRGSSPKLHKPISSKTINIKQAILMQSLSTLDNQMEAIQLEDTCRTNHQMKEIVTERTKNSSKTSPLKKSRAQSCINNSWHKQKTPNNYQNSLTQIQSYKKNMFQPSSRNKIVMKLSDVRALEMKSNNKHAIQAKIKTKIIKTIVGGGKAQLKMINYPDNSQYLKLCGLKQKKSKKIDSFKK